MRRTILAAATAAALLAAGLEARAAEPAAKTERARRAKPAAPLERAAPAAPAKRAAPAKPAKPARAAKPAAPARDADPLARIERGMSFEQVVAILGPPTSHSRRLTIHAFNPFAFGNEIQTTEFRYAGLGRVRFAGPDYRGERTEVLAVEPDPGESGRQR